MFSFLGSVQINKIIPCILKMNVASTSNNNKRFSSSSMSKYEKNEQQTQPLITSAL